MIDNVLDPMNIVAGGGGAEVAPDWNGVAVEAGRERSCTRTDRCSIRDSAKNLAYSVISFVNHYRINEHTSSPHGSEGSPCFVEARGERTPARARFTNW